MPKYEGKDYFDSQDDSRGGYPWGVPGQRRVAMYGVGVVLRKFFTGQWRTRNGSSLVAMAMIAFFLLALAVAVAVKPNPQFELINIILCASIPAILGFALFVNVALSLIAWNHHVKKSDQHSHKNHHDH